MSPDVPAPRTEADAVRTHAAADADAPNGVCRTGAQRIEHVGCVDEELSVPFDAVETCRSGGVRECDQRCQQGDTPSCTALALVHQLALEAAPNTTYAARLYDKACAGGSGPACTDLGVMHAKGLGMPVDFDKAEALYAVACDRGDIVGCADLATSRAWGPQPPENVAHAILTVSDACVSASHPRACAALGELRELGSGTIERDQKTAAELLDRACHGDDAAACERLGRAYLQGDGVKADDAEAMQLFKKACDDARSDACTDLAGMYCMGRGVPRDATRSALLYRQACEAGDTAACRAKACASSAPM